LPTNSFPLSDLYQNISSINAELLGCLIGMKQETRLDPRLSHSETDFSNTNLEVLSLSFFFEFSEKNIASFIETARLFLALGSE
jgi:hypothetical protein